ncbi:MULTISPECIES: hypothetical protein [Enterobacteriaceae]|jgi:hypothetical protein|uniref:hypothetical protein n=1 Tax=Enterobacteriaceae TaxID=543 RepID=UPI0005A606D8|nr:MULTISPECIES: hypothetical protein [Enterobacteriaceae]EKC0108061.1 hypothetical protein [Salmonella enterica]ELS5748261.1 hypothetical protein [Klebsiella aerogenes]HDS8779610.1 hypothetical protein [Klebsiella michiganensis]HEO8921218.1 hypothetical protein [Enterobacter hormaechei subsp. steigerwaltii]MBN4802455.1 hypothetical protein [Enterobacter asburiae]
MTFQELDACIAGSGRRSIASALIAFILDALDDGQDGVDLDTFQSHTHFVRNNVTTVASYLQLHGIIHILYYRDGAAERQYESVNNYGRWAKQHYRPSEALIQLHRRD